MKRLLWGISLLVLASGAANAALVSRLSGQAHYDDVLNITWLANANLAASNTFGVTGINANGTMTWAKANEWIAAMNTANYLGYNDWRLPTVTDTGIPGCDSPITTYTGTDCGYNVDLSTGEMAHMFYSTLGNTGFYNTSGVATGCSNSSPYCLTNAGPFSNLQARYYWSGTTYAPSTSSAWIFSFEFGFQDRYGKFATFYAWAVRSGDIAAVDVTDPTITLTTPANNASYLLNEDVYAEYACDDEIGGSGLYSCAGTVPTGNLIDTATVGAKAFTVDAADNAGNTSSVTHNYVATYLFSGFFQPVDNLPAYNTAKAGRTIPLKWRVTDAKGAPVTTLTSVSVSATHLACDLGSTVDQVEEYVTGQSGLQNLGDGYYQFNWSTPGGYARSCKTVRVNLGDGAVYTAQFSFTK